MNITSLHPRPSVHGEEQHPTRDDSVAQNTVDLQVSTLENNPQSYGVSACLWDGSGWFCHKWHPLGYQANSQR